MEPFSETGSWGAGEPTPAELRELQARAEALERDIALMRERLREQPGVPRAVRAVLPGAAEAAAEAAERIRTAAERLARVRAARGPGLCAALWGLCPHCGPTLRTEDGRSWCRECGTVWEYDRSQDPCPEPGVFVVMDQEGGTVVACAAHGRYMQERIDGGLLLPIPRL